MREIVLDTETTGLSASDGHRIVEIGCLELLNHVPSGNSFHVYINPMRPMPRGAFEVHGLGDEFLAGKPQFAEVAADFAAFIGDDRLIIHNAPFDLGFLNYEFSAIGIAAIDEARVIDTLQLARRKHPAAANSLDALCKRYGVDNSAREKHGALLDAELLAEVYIELIGGRQPHLTLVDERDAGGPSAPVAGQIAPRPRPLAPRLSAGERESHARFVDDLGDGALWRKLPQER